MARKKVQSVTAHLRLPRDLATATKYASLASGVYFAFTGVDSVSDPTVVSNEDMVQSALARCQDEAEGTNIEATENGENIIVHIGDGYVQGLETCMNQQLIQSSEVAQRNTDAQSDAAMALHPAFAVAALVVATIGFVADKVLTKKIHQTSRASTGHAFFEEAKGAAFEYDYAFGYGGAQATLMRGYQKEGHYKVGIDLERWHHDREKMPEDKLVRMLKVLDMTRTCAGFPEIVYSGAIKEGAPVKERLPLHILKDRVVGYIEAINAIRLHKATIVSLDRANGTSEAARYDPADIYADPEAKTLRPLIKVPKASDITTATNISALLENVEEGEPRVGPLQVVDYMQKNM